MKLSQSVGLCAAAALAVTLAVAMDTDSAAATPTVTGKVTGTVTYEGERPEVKPLAISAEQSKGCCPDGVEMNTADPSLLVSDKGGIANVVVTLTVKGEKVEVPEEPFEFDQKQCHFTPHVAIIPEGATVRFLNSDAVSHNIHTYAAKNDGTNQTVAPEGNLDYKLEKSEPVKVACDIHPWMLGWIYVTDATHWGLSDAEGAFTIENVPAGEYKLEIWHEKLGKAKAEVTVAADGSSEPVKVEMGEKKAGGRRRR